MEERISEMGNEKLEERYKTLTLESEDHWDYRGKKNSEKDYVHGFCTYPAMMVPKMQREMLDVYLKENVSRKVRMLDPFAGSGTILVEGMLRGLDIVGVDVNPLAILLCKVKTTIVSIDVLDEKTEQLIKNINMSSKVDLYNFDGISKWFTQRAIEDLSIIRSRIKEEPIIEIRRFYWATLCEVVRLVSNSRDCTYKLHIKSKEDIDAYDKDAKLLFETALKFNVERYKSFYGELVNRKLIKKDGLTYKHTIKIILGDSVEYLKRSKAKYDVVFTSPPYGDNHTTVSYGQYSVLPLRWIESKDIDENVDNSLMLTQCAIDNASLGGRNIIKDELLKSLSNKSITLKKQVEEIQKKAPKQVSKIVSFYHDFDIFLERLSKRLKPDSIMVWTVGNRRVAKQEIYMNKIVAELNENYGLFILTSFTRKITKKRMPEMNAYSGSDKGLQGTMTREHILVFARGDINDKRADVII